MKETWKITNALLNKRSKSTNISSLIEGDTVIQARSDISNAMSNYYCSIVIELADDIDQLPNPLLLGDYLINESNNRMKFTEINEQHIMDIIVKLKTSKGFGNDNISSHLLKLALLYINKSLVYMFNKSLEKGEFLAL